MTVQEAWAKNTRPYLKNNHGAGRATGEGKDGVNMVKVLYTHV
jgi:hypothetical protein